MPANMMAAIAGVVFSYDCFKFNMELIESTELFYRHKQFSTPPFHENGSGASIFLHPTSSFFDHVSPNRSRRPILMISEVSYSR